MAELSEIIKEAAKRYNLSPEMMLRIAQIESGMNPNTANPKSSARGVYQFLTKPGGSWGEYGRGQDVLDPVANVDAGARYIQDNANALRTKLGREPAPWEVYLAHQQGRAGAPALLNNPNRPAVEVLQAFYKDPKTARDAITLNAGRAGMTAGEFANLWKQRYEGGGGGAPGGAGRMRRSTAGEPADAVSGAALPVPGDAGLTAPVTNPAALALNQPGLLGGIFADATAALAKPAPEPLVKRPKVTPSSLTDGLGQPVRLSSG
jgi:hypothetical protein